MEIGLGAIAVPIHLPDIGVIYSLGTGLGEILGKRALDRDVLRDMFFAKFKGMSQPGQQRRRMSLLLLLECIGQAHTARASFGNSSCHPIDMLAELRSAPEALV